MENKDLEVVEFNPEHSKFFKKLIKKPTIRKFPKYEPNQEKRDNNIRKNQYKLKRELFPESYWELKRTDKNKYKFTQEQKEEIRRSRRYNIPVKVAEELDLGVFVIHQVINSLPKFKSERSIRKKERDRKRRIEELKKEIEELEKEVIQLKSLLEII